MNITLRQATIEDVPAIYELVKELAAYENEPDEVWATLEEYQKDFANGWYESIVAEDNGKIVGMMLYYKSYSSWKGKMLYLDDFVVTESYRRKGIGELLFEELTAKSKEWEANLIKWQVLDWNQPAINFYEKYETRFGKNWWNCVLIVKNKAE